MDFLSSYWPEVGAKEDGLPLLVFEVFLVGATNPAIAGLPRPKGGAGIASTEPTPH
jgi:hypothetical protein